MEKEDNRSRKFIFVPFCLICQAFQARGIVKYEWKASINPIIEELIKNDVNIIQMPCPESQFGGYEGGLRREPHGASFYSSKEFSEVCEKCAEEVLDKIRGILKNGYEILGIVGIEMSPSCAVNYQYSNKGMIKKSGFFIEKIKEKLKNEKIEIKFVGVNRKSIQRSLEEIKKLVSNKI
jgi:predicted secreted protein